MRTKNQIIEDMQAEGIKRDRYNVINNEGATDGYNPHEDRLGELSEELMALPDDGPLTTDLRGIRAKLGEEEAKEVGGCSPRTWEGWEQGRQIPCEIILALHYAL